MSDEPVEPDESPAAPPQAPVDTAGALLRRARQAQGMHIAALAAALKVSPQKLELLESDRLDQLPGTTFVRALALSVCKHLKLDADPILALLPATAASQPGLEKVTRGLETPFRERDRRIEPREWPAWIHPTLLVPLLLVVLALAFWFAPTGWLPSRHSGTPAASTAASAPFDAASGVPAGSPGGVVAEPVVPAAVSQAASGDAAPSAPSGAAPAAQPSPTPAPAASVNASPAVFTPPPAGSASMPGVAAAQPAKTTGDLVLRASATSWVEVRDASGVTLLSRTLSAGEVVGLDGSKPLRLTVGNADATQVVFRGRPVALSPTKDSVARIELK